MMPLEREILEDVPYLKARSAKVASPSSIRSKALESMKHLYDEEVNM